MIQSDSEEEEVQMPYSPDVPVIKKGRVIISAKDEEPVGKSLAMTKRAEEIVEGNAKGNIRISDDNGAKVDTLSGEVFLKLVKMWTKEQGQEGDASEDICSLLQRYKNGTMRAEHKVDLSMSWMVPSGLMEILGI